MNHVDMAREILADQEELESLRNRVTHLERVIKASILTHGTLSWNPVANVKQLDQYSILEGIGKWEIILTKDLG